MGNTAKRPRGWGGERGYSAGSKQLVDGSVHQSFDRALTAAYGLNTHEWRYGLGSLGSTSVV